MTQYILRERVAALGALLALCLIVGLTYANSLQLGLAGDGRAIILDDPRVQTVSSENIARIFSEDYWWPHAVGGLYRPVTKLTFLMENAAGFGDRATGYHRTNVFLHVVNVLLAYVMMRRVARNAGIAFGTALLFGIHPITTEAVTNLTGRADLLASFGVLGSLCAYTSVTNAGSARRAWHLIAALMLTVGLFAKENAIAGAGTLVLYEWWRSAADKPQLNFNAALTATKRSAAVWGIPVLIWIVVRSWVAWHSRIAELAFVDNPLVDAEFWTGRLTALKVLGEYLGLFVWPSVLSNDYSFNQIPLVQWPLNFARDWGLFVSITLLVLGVGYAATRSSQQRVGVFLIGWVVLTLLPTANLIVLIGSIKAERFLYLPAIGLSGIAAECFSTMTYYVKPGRIKNFLAVLIMCAIALACAYRTRDRNLDWNDDSTLWHAALRASPNSYKPYKVLAFQQYSAGEVTHIDDAIRLSERALAITDRDQALLLNAGIYYRTKGDIIISAAHDAHSEEAATAALYYRRALFLTQRAMALDSEFNRANEQRELAKGKTRDQVSRVGNAKIYQSVGVIHMRLHEPAKAQEAFDSMREIAPSNPDAYLSLAMTYRLMDDIEHERQVLIAAMLLAPTRMDTKSAFIKNLEQDDARVCVVHDADNTSSLDANCQVIRATYCQSAGSLTQSLRQANLPNMALAIASDVNSRFDCQAMPR